MVMMLFSFASTISWFLVAVSLEDSPSTDRPKRRSIHRQTTAGATARISPPPPPRRAKFFEFEFASASEANPYPPPTQRAYTEGNGKPRNLHSRGGRDRAPARGGVAGLVDGKEGARRRRRVVVAIFVVVGGGGVRCTFFLPGGAMSVVVERRVGQVAIASRLRRIGPATRLFVIFGKQSVAVSWKRQ